MNFWEAMHIVIISYTVLIVQFYFFYFCGDELKFISLFMLDLFMRFLGPIIFIFLLLGIIMVRITTPRMRIETMTRLGWQPMLWLLIVVFAFYFLGWFMA